MNLRSCGSGLGRAGFCWSGFSRDIFCGCIVLFSGVVATAAPPVYKCEEGGKITYTDQPCSPGAHATPLPGLIVTAPPVAAQRDLARKWDERIARERGDRDRADAEWLKQHGQRVDREERVRRAILEHRVIKSMTMDEVRRALGEPDEVDTGDSYGTDKQTWTYVDGGSTRKVNFKNGEVTSTSSKGQRRR